MNDRGDVNSKRSALALWVPLGSVGAALAFAAIAGSVWSGDRAELHSGTTKNEKQDDELRAHQQSIDQLKLDSASRSARDEDLRRTLDRMQSAIDKIADRVGAKP